MTHFSPSSDNSFLSTIKPHLGFATSVCSMIMAGIFAYGTWQHNNGIADTDQKDLKRRVELLEADRATRSEVQSLAASFNEYKADSKARLDKITDLLMQDLRYHKQAQQ